MAHDDCDQAQDFNLVADLNRGSLEEAVLIKGRQKQGRFAKDDRMRYLLVPHMRLVFHPGFV